MTENTQTKYRPESVSPPGDSLLDTLDALGMSQAELADRSGLTAKTINLIISGKAPLTENTALALERVLGVPASFWLARESKYREYLARKDEEDLKHSHAEWARSFPYKKMADLGWVEATSKAEEKAYCLLRFFGVSDRYCWETIWSEPQATYRQTARDGKKAEIISSWLRKGEIEAQELQAPEYDEEKFKRVIKSLRALTNESDPKVFMDEIQDRCLEAGVVFLLIRELPSLGIYGVTRWFSGTPMIQQSLLLKTHDHFWFTFFHEAKHVLQKVKKHIFVEGNQLSEEDKKREEEANRFARELLIPEVEYKAFIERESFSRPAIQTFAKSIAIHPGIVVGRLQRDGHIHYTHPARKLKVHFKWTS